jgi:hypothetical protein
MPTAAPVTTTPTPVSTSGTGGASLPNGNAPTGDSGVTANQYALQPGESTAAYSTRIAGLRAAGGGPTPGPAPTDITSAEDQVAQSLGYKSYADAQTQLSAPPTQSETDLYNSAYAAAGLDTLNTQITSKENDLNTALGNNNDNPWLDEADRVGRNKNLTTLATGDIKNLTDQYNTGLKGVQDLVTRESADQTATTKSNSAKLTALEAQAKALAASNTTTAKTAATPPKTIKGGTTGATYQWNPTTQTFDQILPGKTATTKTSGAKTPVAAASPTGTGAQFANYNFTATQLGALNAKGLNQSDANGILQDIKKGQTLNDIRNQMTASGIDPGLLDTIMQYVDPAHNTPAKTTKSTSGRTL